MTDRPGARRRLLGLGIVALMALGTASCTPAEPASLPSPTKATSLPPAPPESPSKSAPLTAPKTSTAQDGQYFTDLAKADPGLATYVQAYGNVALRALLTDGSAFCAFLVRGGGIDYAMAAVVIGAKTVEARTHLPATVTTFNAVDAVALLTLCPSAQHLVPAADEARIRKLGHALNG